MTTEHGSHPRMLRAVIATDAFAAGIERCLHIAAQQAGRPAAMKRLEKPVVVVRLAAKRDQLIRVGTRAIQTVHYGVVPESPRCFEQRWLVLKRYRVLACPPVDIFGFWALWALDEGDLGAELEQQRELAAPALR